MSQSLANEKRFNRYNAGGNLYNWNKSLSNGENTRLSSNFVEIKNIEEDQSFWP